MDVVLKFFLHKSVKNSIFHLSLYWESLQSLNLVTKISLNSHTYIHWLKMSFNFHNRYPVVPRCSQIPIYRKLQVNWVQQLNIRMGNARLDHCPNEKYNWYICINIENKCSISLKKYKVKSCWTQTPEDMSGGVKGWATMGVKDTYAIP